MFPSDRNAEGRPMLLNYPVYFSPSGNAMTAGLKPISFGAHSLCVRRDVKNSLATEVFVERYAELGKIGYETYLRTDFGVPVSGGNCPIRVLAMHS
jgi:HK97 family phage major capsid protein